MKLNNKELLHLYEKEGNTKLRYGDNSREGMYHALRLHNILMVMKDIREESICDIGTGDGILIDKIRTNFDYIICCDISISYLERNICADERILCTWDKAPLKIRSVDIVVAFDVLEHVIDFENGIKQCGHIAKKYIAISIPLDGWHRRLARLFKVNIENKDKSFGHVHVYRYDDVKQKVLDNLKGYKIVKERFIYMTPSLLIYGIPINILEKLNQFLANRKYPGMQWVIWLFERRDY